MAHVDRDINFADFVLEVVDDLDECLGCDFDFSIEVVGPFSRRYDINFGCTFSGSHCFHFFGYVRECEGDFARLFHRLRVILEIRETI